MKEYAEHCLLLILIGMCIRLGILLNDFYNDYKCSTTNDQIYWEEHNCKKYSKEFKK